ncbi:MAG TPA: FG-GAP-like repeat-containing protein [Candidatus Acidoferrales bacterium]|nr:FG-GAP-like repeat-containing protein [Candidatus Acidoferrales bacterium]
MHSDQPAQARRPGDISGPVTLNCSTDKKSFDIRGDTQSAYEEVARQFRVDVAFDVDLRSIPVRLHVNDVDCSTTLELLAATTGTFWHPLTSSLFFVAQDTQQKRKDYDISLVQTFVLPAAETPEDMTEIFRTVRDITGVTRSDLDPRSHTLTLRAPPQSIAVAGALISNLEQPVGELVLEIEALEIDRSFARDLGITPPENSKIFSLSSQEIQEAEGSYEGLVDVIDEIFGSTSIPSVLAFGGGASTFLAELPNATASFSEALSLVRQGRRVLLRAKDGQPANFFVGDRIPVALSNYSSSLAPGPGSGNSSIPPIMNYTTGTAPSSVTSASLRDDGNNDLIVANSGDNTVSVLLGNGDGTFQSQVTYGTGSNPVSVTTGQFNSIINGYLDLAVANKDSNTLSILLGNGDGTFKKQTNLNTGHLPVSVIAANFHDLTSGTEVDLAVANQDDNTISIFQGNGDGTFKAPTSISLPSGYEPAGLASADLNGDGHIDLVVADSGSNTISVLLGNGDGTFRQRTDYPTGSKPVCVAFGDFNGDGASDIAIANQSGNSVSIYYNQETSSGVPLGTFIAGSTRDFSAGNGPTSIAVADYNLDGIADLAISDITDNAVTVLLNAGNDSFTPLSELPVGNGPVSIASADFNGDGRPDAATADSGSAETTVILNSTSLFGPGGSSPNSIFPGVQYLDIGLKVKVTPRIHPDNSVTLGLDFEMSSLTGQSLNTIPVISNESLSQTVRVKQNETAAIGGFLQQQYSNVINGTPGISSLPGLGLIDKNQNAQDQKTELLILVTPRTVRRESRENHRIYAGKGSLDGNSSFETTYDERGVLQPPSPQLPLSPARQPPLSSQPQAQIPQRIGPQDQSNLQPATQEQSPDEPPQQ